ncbi:cellulose binding domain-containing protein [Actinomadura sp. DC4]|uniref:cellulose binding domain-containing protein n=1 Tax=Actinomadura sp. DC4 TaxID=3055069 RepID=UPI0025AFD09A|nr:cellulose binding domain-containing protein [Actinomadura sp. DC4]MDN3358900.1 cellulose binding domain-containing protein [Actinomadura sp. DC4]
MEASVASPDETIVDWPESQRQPPVDDRTAPDRAASVRPATGPTGADETMMDGPAERPSEAAVTRETPLPRKAAPPEPVQPPELPELTRDLPSAIRRLPGPWYPEAAAQHEQTAFSERATGPQPTPDDIERTAAMPRSAVPPVPESRSQTGRHPATTAGGPPYDPGSTGPAGTGLTNTPAANTVEEPIPAYAPSSGRPESPPDPTLTRGPGHPSGPYGPPNTGPTSGGNRRRLTAAIIAVGAAIVAAGATAIVFTQVGGSTSHPKASCAPGGCATTAKSAVPAPVKFRYRTVERDTGYFEGTVTLVNRGKSPIKTWTLTFTYPGADIHNAWEVVLQGKGQNVTIVNAPTAPPIAPGHSFEVRFGGGGSPGTPVACRFNNAPCAFTR